MKIKESKKAFIAFIKDRGLSIKEINFETGFKVAVSFYKETECEKLSNIPDGDMLLFQWGNYNWGNGKNFELDITRQFYVPESEESDQEIWQLKLISKYRPSSDLEKIAGGNIWCHSRSVVAEFIEKVLDHESLKATRNLSGSPLEIEWERV